MFTRKRILSITAFVIGLAALPPVDDVRGEPLPGVKVNGADGAVSVIEGTPVTVSVTLDPQDFAGVSADWWVVADTPLGVFWLTANGDWIASELPIRVFSGDLFGVDDFPIVSTDLLPSGRYTFYFGVDTAGDNGALDLNQLYLHGTSVDIGRAPTRR